MTDVPFDLSRRDERALSLHIAGTSLEDLAEKFAWTIEETRAAIERALVRVSVDRNPEGVAFARNVQQQRLDALLKAMWPAALDQTLDVPDQTSAVKTVLNIVDRQAALMGTNAPKETMITHQISPDQVASTIERLFAARSGVIEAEVVRPGITSGPEILDAEIEEDGDPT